jgi:hypothetical protein
MVLMKWSHFKLALTSVPPAFLPPGIHFTPGATLLQTQPREAKKVEKVFVSSETIAQKQFYLKIRAGRAALNCCCTANILNILNI